MDEKLSDHAYPEEKDRINLVRWNVGSDEILSANSEQLRVLMINMNDQIKRLYDLRMMEIDLQRPLNREEVDYTLHPQKAGLDEQSELAED